MIVIAPKGHCTNGDQNMLRAHFAYIRSWVMKLSNRNLPLDYTNSQSKEKYCCNTEKYELSNRFQNKMESLFEKLTN